MADKHMKRIMAPATWLINRKELKFVARPKGSFSLDTGMPLITILKDVLGLVRTSKEGKRVLYASEILVNGVRRKDEKLMVGLMDVLAIKALGKSYRVLLDRNRILRLVPITEAEAGIRPCKIVGKKLVSGGKVQLALHDGRTTLGSAGHATGDTVVLSVPDAKITGHLKLEKGCQAYMIGGSNVGRTGIVDNISGDTVMIRIGDGVVEAARRFVFVTGKDKPVVKSVLSFA